MTNQEIDLQGSQGAKPDYVKSLEAAYGAPSQQAFGSAVFFEHGQPDDDLEEIAKKYYQYYVGDLWQKWGEKAWLSSWKKVYTRSPTQKHQIGEELGSIKDFNVQLRVGMIVDQIENAAAASEALSQTYDAPDVASLYVFNIGDGEAMSGLLLAGQRANGEATFLVFLMD